MKLQNRPSPVLSYLTVLAVDDFDVISFYVVSTLPIPFHQRNLRHDGFQRFFILLTRFESKLPLRVV